MKENKEAQFNARHEVNLKLFFQKILQNKLFFVLSAVVCLALAFVYIKLATPKYEASTSILIDASGNRALGDSKYVDGGVGLIDVEKNLYNEIGIIKSFSLIRQTVEDLGYDLSYYTEDFIKKKEAFGYYPFEVVLDKSKPQLYGVPFQVELLQNGKYRISIESNEFYVSNPSNGSTREINRDFRFSQELAFGQTVTHDYFNFTLKKPEYKVVNEDFKELQLSFVVNSLDAVAGGYSSNVCLLYTSDAADE